VIIPDSKLPAGAEIHIAPSESRNGGQEALDGMPLPGLLDALKARDGVVLASEKQGESFSGPLFYKWRLEN